VSQISNVLPFPRGETYAQDGAITMAATTASELEGKLYRVEDSLHGTGEDVILRCVRCSAAITVAYKLMSFAAAKFNLQIDGISGTAGEVCKPLDDKYASDGAITTIVQYDLCYVVEEGPCDILSAAGGITTTALEAVGGDGAGAIKDSIPTAGQAVIGTAAENMTVAATAYRVNVRGNCHPSDAAG